MSAAVMIGTLDRGLRGELRLTLHRGPDYLACEHFERDGRAGGKLVLRLNEIDSLVSALNRAKSLAAAPGRHRSLSAAELERQLEEDRALF